MKFRCLSGTTFAKVSIKVRNDVLLSSNLNAFWCVVIDGVASPSGVVCVCVTVLVEELITNVLGTGHVV